MLTGEFRHTLDAKGRVFVPAKFRADRGQNVVVAKTFGKFLIMYSEPEWENFMERLDDIDGDENDIYKEKMKRYLMKNSVPTEVDAQGRISIRADQREFAKLDKEISFIGMRKYVEIWSSSEADDETDSYDLEKFKSLARGLGLG